MTGHTGLKGQAGPSTWGSALTKAKEHALEYLQCCHTMAVLIRNTNLSQKLEYIARVMTQADNRDQPEHSFLPTPPKKNDSLELLQDPTAFTFRREL